MTKKQRRFVEEYLIDLNATKAAIRAGYSPKTAKQIGQRMLTFVDIQSAISKAEADRSRRTGLNQDRVVQELAKVAFVNITDLVDVETATIKDSATAEDTACISSVRVKTLFSKDGPVLEREVKIMDKLKALELLGKHLGLFTDRVRLEGVVPVVLYDDIPPE